jgi:alpha-glucosidase
MPWTDSAPNLGFSPAEPWLPVGESHRGLAVEAQERDSHSLLQFTRACLRLRNHHPALRQGGMLVLEAGEQRLVFERWLDGERLRCTFNLSAESAPFSPHGRALLQAGEIEAGRLGAFASIVEAVS